MGTVCSANPWKSSSGGVDLPPPHTLLPSPIHVKLEQKLHFDVTPSIKCPDRLGKASDRDRAGLTNLTPCSKMGLCPLGHFHPTGQEDHWEGFPSPVSGSSVESVHPSRRGTLVPSLGNKSMPLVSVWKILAVTQKNSVTKHSGSWFKSAFAVPVPQTPHL